MFAGKRGHPATGANRDPRTARPTPEFAARRQRRTAQAARQLAASQWQPNVAPIGVTDRTRRTLKRHSDEIMRSEPDVEPRRERVAVTRSDPVDAVRMTSCRADETLRGSRRVDPDDRTYRVRGRVCLGPAGRSSAVCGVSLQMTLADGSC